MKKVFVVFTVCATIWACNSSGDQKAADGNSTPSANTTALPDDKGLEMIGALDCTTCHKIDEKSIGPAYTDVAKKYEATDAIIDSLSNKVINGGSGVWGTVPMSAHPGLSLDSARTMVKYILSLKNKS